MTYLARFLGALSVILVAAVSCGGKTGDGDGDGDGDGRGGPVAADDFPARLARAHCSNIAACCQRFGESFDLSSCLSVSEDAMRDSLSMQFMSSRVVFDEVVAGECIDAYAALLSACTERALSDGLERCRGLFKGTVPLGGDCEDSDECRDEEAYCDAGVCVQEEPYLAPDERPRGSLGDVCSLTCQMYTDGSFSCGSSSTAPVEEATCWVEDGLSCAANGTCQAVPALGEPCSSSFCATGSYCDLDTCVAPTADGPCNSDEACVATSYCDYDLGQCVPRQPDGAPCDSAQECLGGDCEHDRCRQWSVASDESCAGLFDD